MDLVERHESWKEVFGLPQGEGKFIYSAVYWLFAPDLLVFQITSASVDQSFGCGFFQWVDDELNPFLTQLLLDLRNAVWVGLNTSICTHITRTLYMRY